MFKFGLITLLLLLALSSIASALRIGGGQSSKPIGGGGQPQGGGRGSRPQGGGSRPLGGGSRPRGGGGRHLGDGDFNPPVGGLGEPGPKR